MKIVLYSTGCPKCNVLKKKMDMRGIKYEESDDIDFLIKRGIQQAPVLDVDGELLDFIDANKWINCWKGDNSIG